MGRNGHDQPQHLIGDGANFPLGAVATTQVEEVLQTAAVHCHDHFRLAGVGQHKTGVLVGLLACLGTGGFLVQTLSHQAGGMGVFQRLDQFQVFLASSFIEAINCALASGMASISGGMT